MKVYKYDMNENEGCEYVDNERVTAISLWCAVWIINAYLSRNCIFIMEGISMTGIECVITVSIIIFIAIIFAKLMGDVHC